MCCCGADRTLTGTSCCGIVLTITPTRVVVFQIEMMSKADTQWMRMIVMETMIILTGNQKPQAVEIAGTIMINGRTSRIISQIILFLLLMKTSGQMAGKVNILSVFCGVIWLDSI